MLNQTIIVGRLVSNPTKEIEENETTTKIILAVPRNFKNSNGEYETDFFPVTLYKGIGETTTEYCKKGDLIGIKGRLQTKDNQIVIIAEKVTFLSSRKENEE